MRVKLKHLDELTAERKKDALRYLTEIKNPKIKLPKMQFGELGHVFHLFVIEVEDRDKFMRYCENHEIGLKIHYPQPPHLSEAYRDLGYKNGDFPITEMMADHIVSIPLYNGINLSQMKYIIECLNNY